MALLVDAHDVYLDGSMLPTMLSKLRDNMADNSARPHWAGPSRSQGAILVKRPTLTCPR
jgi:hypothetical protein